MSEVNEASIVHDFRRRFGSDPEWIVRAPGRVNLIGEHTDYNGGFVLPMAIDRWVWIAGRPGRGRRVLLRSAQFGEECSLDLDERGERGNKWSDYAGGIAWSLREAGLRLSAFEGVVSSDVPVGAGLSSSAAFEMAVGRAFSRASGFEWDVVTMARAGQRAENEWVGVSCGIMDQLISAGGAMGHALLIDCRSLVARPVPLPPEVSVVVLDTMTRRQLAGSEYNDRGAQCAAAAAACGVPSLRDVTMAQLEAVQRSMDPTAFRRARHVLTENERTVKAAEAMVALDIEGLGRLMNESHQSLRDDFEVSTSALDAMVGCARGAPGCVGARLTGAGFGGCVVAAVARDDVVAFVPRVAAEYERSTGLRSNVYVCRAVSGAEIVAGP